MIFFVKNGTAGRKSQFVCDIPFGTYRGIHVFKIQTKIIIKAKLKNNKKEMMFSM